MSNFSFEWDPNKNISNSNKHGISFEEARTSFTDEFARYISDPDHSDIEERFILMGTSIESRLLIVCHCIRDEEIIRIISARKADKKEHRIYETFRYAQ